jgi:rod shape-determining protein MreD
MVSKALWTLFIGVVALAVQGSARHLGLPEAAVPQLLVVVVVSLAFSEVNAFGGVMAFVLGLLLDFSSAVLVGPWAGAFVVVFGALALLSHRLFIESGVVAMVISGFAVIAANLLFSVLGAEYPIITWEYPQRIIGQAVVTALCAPVLLSVISRRSRKSARLFVGRGSPVSAV